MDFGRRTEVSRNRWFTERTSILTVPSCHVPCRLPKPVILVIIVAVSLSTHILRTRRRQGTVVSERDMYSARGAIDVATARSIVPLGRSPADLAQFLPDCRS